MIIAVGTTNPAKLDGVRRAFQRFYPESAFRPVASGDVTKRQPFGLEEISRGAVARAKFALAKAGGDFGVGVEAGIFELGGSFFDHQQAAIVDTTGLVTLGHSAGYALPSVRIRRLLDEGDELEEFGAELTGVKDIGDRGGIVHYFTNGAISRSDLTEQSVLTALIPRLHSDLYGRP
ncbi:MAG TPA: inosine/xanthosine triphosphatase [Nitrososphaerales archaeon]|nr:inosine/xanthosine triphosphatase [Nitrososphaerales archaeon]